MRKLMKLGVIGATVALGFAGLTACSSGNESPAAPETPAEETPNATEELIPLSIQVNPTYWETPIRHAIDEGWFEEAGIDVTAVPYGVDAPLPMVLNGETEVGVFGTGSIITAVAQGADIRMIGGLLVEGDDFSQQLAGVVATEASGITDLKGLEGKKVAVQELKGPSQAKVIDRMVDAGADPSGVQWIAMPFPGMVEAMERGDVEAAVAVQPFVGQMMAAGGVHISRVSEPGSSVPAYFAKADFVDTHPELAERLAAVINRAWDYGNANRDEMKQRFVKDADLPEAAMAGLPDMDWHLAPDRAALEDTVNTMIAAGFMTEEIPYEKLVDERFAK